MRWEGVLLLLSALTVACSAQAAPVCPLLDASGCCGRQCRMGLCAALYQFGTALNAHNTLNQFTWYNRQGWQHLYSASSPAIGTSPSTAAKTACSILQEQQAAAEPGTATDPQAPFFCSWYGVVCNTTVYSSTCSSPAEQMTGIFKIEIVNNNLSGNLSSSAFMESLSLLHDCGLRFLVLGGGYGELRGQMGPGWGKLSELLGLSLFTTNLTGQLPAEIGNLTALEYLDLGSNYITGTLPKSIGNLASLRLINLGKNGWTDKGKALGGPLPSSITNLTKLEVLSLESNELSGTLPANMCSDMTALRAISLRDNRFTGPITQMSRCILQALDLSNNKFTGPLPAPIGSGPWGRPPWLRLMSISMSNNHLTGTLPEYPYGAAPLISIIQIAGNNLTGTFPRSWTILPWLSQLDLSYNNLSGTVPYELAFQSMLTSLRLHSNPQISGTISPWFRLTVSLQTITLHNTSMTGALPGVTRAAYMAHGFDTTQLCRGDGAGLGRLPSLQLATISDTAMTALCDKVNGDCDDISAYLPWYLAADPNVWEVPLPEPGFADNAHMKCPRVIQEDFCRLYRPPESFPDTMRPSWSVSPSYFQYKGCMCMGGYDASYVKKSHFGVDIDVLVCQPSPSTLDPAAAAGISVAASFLGLMLLAYCGYVSWYGRWGLPRLQRAVANLQKRREGAPTSGRMSIVVTDIESYSALMVKMPLAMGQAMSQHSNVIRRAAWTHYGFVVGQEGDSFVLAFRDALDAVAFCLQVQQGLVKVPWPAELLKHQQQTDLDIAAPAAQQSPTPSSFSALQDPAAAAAAASDAASSQPTESGDTGPHPLAVPLMSPQAAFPSSPTQSLAGLQSGGLGREESLPPLGLANSFDATSSGLPVASAAVSGGSGSPAAPSLLDLLLARSGSSRLWQRQQQNGSGSAQGPPAKQQDTRAGPAAPSPTPAAGLRFGRRRSSQEAAPGSPAVSAAGTPQPAFGPRDSCSSPQLVPSAAAVRSGSSPVDPWQPVSPVVYAQQYQQQQQQQKGQAAWLAPASVLVPGLRVRMGVASGMLADREDCLNSSVLETARVVSDAGSGGQVLLDSITFSIIKDRLEELGQVGASGYVSSSRVTGWGAPKGWLARLARRHVTLAAEAVALDMGLYSLPGAAVKPGADHKGLLPDLPAAALPTAVQSSTAAAAAGGLEAGDAAALRNASAAAGAAAGLTSPKGAEKTAQLGQRASAAAGDTSKGAGTPSQGCVRLYQILAPKCLPRALLFGNKLALKRGALCHDLPYFCAPAAASQSLLDMLLLEGPSGHAPLRSSFSNGSGLQAGWGASRLWLRQKYRLPLVASRSADAPAQSGSNTRAGGLLLPGRSSLSVSVHSPSNRLTHRASGPLTPASPLTRVQSGSLQPYSRAPASPIMEHVQERSSSPCNGLSILPAPAAVAAGGDSDEAGGGGDSVPGSMQSAATSNTSAWPSVSIPLKGLTALWPGPGADAAAGAAGAASTGGITFVFASATLPRSVRAEGGQVVTQASAVIGTLVRQTLLAFAAAAGSDAGMGGSAGLPNNSSSSSSSRGAAGYLFRECAADMKYLLAFHSPKVALEWCLLLQEALLWQEWPAAITAASRSTEPGPYTSAAAAVAVAASQQQQQQPLPLALLSPTGPLSPAGAPGQAAAAVDGVTTQAGPAQPEAAGGDASLGPAAGAAAGISSQVLYCGPRVKMGVAAGAPQSVSPDYMGRADYHGNAVNMAARYEAVCAQPGQIVCDATLAESVMVEWAAAAAEATAVQQELLRMSAAAQGSYPAAAAAATGDSGPGGSDHSGTASGSVSSKAPAPLSAAATAAAAAAAESGHAQHQGTQAWRPSSPFAASMQQQAALLHEADALSQPGAAAAPAPAALQACEPPLTLQAATAVSLSPQGPSVDGDTELLLWHEPSLASNSSDQPAAVQQAEVQLTALQQPRAVQGAAVTDAPYVASPATTPDSGRSSGRRGSTEFASFALACPEPAQHSITSPFASATTAGPAAQHSPPAAAAGLQAARGRSIPLTPPRPTVGRAVVGSAPPASAAAAGAAGGWTSPTRGSPPRQPAATAGPAAAAADGGQQAGVSSSPSSTSAAGLYHPGRRTSSPGRAPAAAAAAVSPVSVSPFSGAAAEGPSKAGSGSNFPGVPGLGGGFGFYGQYGSSRRLSINAAGSNASLNAPQQQQWQQQQSVKGSKGGALRSPGYVGGSGNAGVQPHLLPLQPPVALPCPAAVPEGLPAFEVSVQTHRLGRYDFKGAAAPIPMIDVCASHLVPRRQQLQDPALMPKGPKGGLVEPQQGLVDAVQGVTLPGLAHVYRHLHHMRSAAAAAAAGAASAQRGRQGAGHGVFGVHRFLRPSLQPLQDISGTDRAGSGISGASSSSLPTSGQQQQQGSKYARQSSLPNKQSTAAASDDDDRVDGDAA